MIDDEKLDALDKDAADALSHTHQDPFSLVARNALLVCVGDQQQAIAALRQERAKMLAAIKAAKLARGYSIALDDALRALEEA